MKKSTRKKTGKMKIANYLGPELMDMVVKAKVSNWKGKCYTTKDCKGVPTNASCTVAECKALRGKSWKGNWKGAGCICNI